MHEFKVDVEALLLQAQKRIAQLQAELATAQIEKARAEASTTEADDALERLNEQQSRRKWDSDVAFKTRLVLAVRNRLRVKERKIRIRTSRIMRKLKVSKTEELKLMESVLR